tara:strand:- start:703 stop:873 length:171 start_codon:yes stop_codon:yes gene_type:complete
MRDIEKEIKELEFKIMLSPTLYSLDPITNHRIKLAKFKVAKAELLLMNRIETPKPF